MIFYEEGRLFEGDTMRTVSALDLGLRQRMEAIEALGSAAQAGDDFAERLLKELVCKQAGIDPAGRTWSALLADEECYLALLAFSPPWLLGEEK